MRTWIGTIGLVLLVCAYFGGGIPLFSQQPLQMKVNLVDVSFTAHDPAGHLVRDLKRDEVTVFEDAIPQKIAFFSPASDLPLTFGLIVDVSGSQDHFSKQHKHDLEVFLNHVLRPQDRAFLVCFGNHLRLVNDYTNVPADLLASLARFEHKGGSGMPQLGPDEQRDLGTALNDAVFYATTEKLASAPGRRALLIFSDGEENASAHDTIDSIEAAQAANVQLYTIRYTQPEHGRLTPRNQYGIRVMSRMARETGALSIDAVHTDPTAYFQQIADSLNASYELAYYPSEPEGDSPANESPTGDGIFRKIAIKTSRPGVTTLARTGYMGR